MNEGTISYTIAVLRGGNVKASESLVEGADILKSLTAIGYTPLDVVIDHEGQWTLKGMPTDAHYVFTLADSVVDTVHDRNTPWRDLARKMWLPLLLAEGDDITCNREDMYRLFRQKGLPAPKTFVVRSSSPIPKEHFRELWQTYHTPLMVRPLEKGRPSSLVRGYLELEKVLADYHKDKIDVHILTYKPTRTISLAVLPQFRGEALYTPLPVETFSPHTELPRKDHPMRPMHKAGDDENEKIRNIALQAYRALGLQGHACVDMVKRGDDYMVINIDTNPSLLKDGRFVQSLSTTGADLGQYIHSRVTTSPFF